MPLVYLARKLTKLSNVKIAGIHGDWTNVLTTKDRRAVKGVNLVYILLCLITIYYIPKRCTAKAIHLSE